MKKILGIIGSPRKLGNSEIMIKEISRHVEVPHELKLLRVSDFNILPCRGCYACLFKAERCVLKDDLYTILDAMLEADALIVSAPAYFLGTNASLKRLLDRGLAFYTHVEKLWGKPSVGAGIAGIQGKEGHTLLGIENFLNLTLTENKGTTMVYGALPGEIFMNGQNKKTASALASALFGPPLEKKGPCCPLCGGETFRFLPDGMVRCMLCSNTGTMVMKESGPVFDIKRGDHELFLNKEDVIRHKEWLVGMKSRFIEHKKELKEISTAYLEGNWIKPD
ncbi:flavodoxin family protein [Desulfococcaceae bacterium HSG8]|nr:flavodoxin family protein [Desulfococcaceae bacterium HSG8]